MSIPSQYSGVTRSGPLEVENRTILFDYANEIKTNHIDGLYQIAKRPVDNEEKKSLWQRIKDFFPTYWPWSVGSSVGWAVGQTYGQDISNSTIEWVLKNVFANEIAADAAKAAQSTVYQKFVSWVKNDVAQPSIVEAAKMAITPSVQPYISAALGLAGGITVTAGVMLAQYLIVQAMGNRPRNIKLEDLKNAASLIRIDEKSKVIFVGNKAITENAMRKVVYRVNQYAFCKELQNQDKKNIDSFLWSKTFVRPTDGKLVLEDGYVLTEKDERALIKTVQFLSYDNPTNEVKSIKKVVNLFSKHVRSDPKSSTIMCEGHTYMLPNREIGERVLRKV